MRLLASKLVFGRINNNLYRLFSRELTRPADDILFCVFVEIPLAKREGIERVEELTYLLDSNLNRSFNIHDFGCITSGTPQL